MVSNCKDHLNQGFHDTSVRFVATSREASFILLDDDSFPFGENCNLLRRAMSVFSPKKPAKNIKNLYFSVNFRG